MTEGTAITALQRALKEAREAKKQIEGRLIELEAEATTLRTQLVSLTSVIEKTSVALRDAIFPEDAFAGERMNERAAVERPSAERYEREVQRYPAPPPYSSPPAAPERPPKPTYQPEPAEIEAIDDEVATLKLSERDSNIRFTDFRIPQAATIVLREAGRALHVSEIYRRMADGGFEFRGQHQLITLAVSLSRAKRFRKVAPGTFELDPRYSAGQVA